ncbi:MAG: hypothetical protein KBH99_11025 [Syntrophobacteraceae bacterium]|nr:hypothetical protein [Syntrophobacteraceae bacterium]
MAKGTGAEAGYEKKAVLSRRLSFVQGRADYVPDILSREDFTRLATLVFGKSAMIHILVQSHGFVVVPEHVECLGEGAVVTVYSCS